MRKFTVVLNVPIYVIPAENSEEAAKRACETLFQALSRKLLEDPTWKSGIAVEIFPMDAASEAVDKRGIAIIPRHGGTGDF